MWNEEVARVLGLSPEEVTAGEDEPRAAAATPASDWTSALRALRDELDCDFFDWLSAVDEGDGRLTVLAHVWSVTRRRGVLLRTELSEADGLALDSAVDVYAGASWHERETREMFGVDFLGHPNLVPLLLPAEFEGRPLRKDFVLAARVAKPWPGAKEPGGDHGSGRKRQPMRPPGVPAPGEWGPKQEGADLCRCGLTRRSGWRESRPPS